MLMKIRRKNSRFSILVAIAFGVGSGIYIWKPYLEEQKDKLDREKITKDENKLTRWQNFKLGMKHNFTFKAFLIMAGLSGLVLYKLRFIPEIKRNNRLKTGDMMEKLYQQKKEREAEKNWKFT